MIVVSVCNDVVIERSERLIACFMEQPHLMMDTKHSAQTLNVDNVAKQTIMALGYRFHFCELLVHRLIDVVATKHNT